MTFVRIFYAELEKKREKNGNFSHRSAHVVEASVHLLPCFQAPVHPCSLTCSLVWNQLQKAAVILCYSASPILKAAIKIWQWLKAIQLAVTVKQKPRVNWNLFPPCPPPLLFSSWSWRHTSPPPSWEGFARWGWEKNGTYTGEAYYSGEKRTKEGEYTPGREVCLSWILLSSCAASLRCRELGKWRLVGWLLMCLG